MSVATRVVYRNRPYLVTWNGITKKPIAVEVWVRATEMRTAVGQTIRREPYWQTCWALPRTAGKTVRSVIALAEKASPL